MIIDDCDLVNHLKTNTLLYILLENSLRSRRILYLIKSITKKTQVYTDIKNKYTNSITNMYLYENTCFIIELYDYDLKSLNNIIFFVKNAIKKNNIIVIILNQFDKNCISYLLSSLSLKYLIIKFNDFNKILMYKWFYQNFAVENIHITEYQMAYIIIFFENDLSFFISALNTYKIVKKNTANISLMNLLLISNKKMNKYVRSLSQTNNNIVYNLYLYKNSIIKKDYINMFYNITCVYNNDNSNICNLNDFFIILNLLLLDINIKKNNIYISWLLILNIIINSVFKNI